MIAGEIHRQQVIGMTAGHLWRKSEVDHGGMQVVPAHYE